MAVAAILLLMGPVILILGITESMNYNPDSAFLIVVGAILTIIDIIILVCTIISKRKPDTNPTPTTSMTLETYLQQEKAKKDAELNKPASVVKRGIAGTIIGGVPGAIIGAASAIDKNNRNKK